MRLSPEPATMAPPVARSQEPEVTREVTTGVDIWQAEDLSGNRPDVLVRMQK